MCLCASARVGSGVSDSKLRRSAAKERMSGSFRRLGCWGFRSGVRSGLWLRDLSPSSCLLCSLFSDGAGQSSSQGLPRVAFVSISEGSSAGSPSRGRVQGDE
ncbi:hypothetical protein DY000_02013868 [Brassica cretica]|uniref:Uncharacterized protein n=1 Tax=Brassica cretica TaxID=69181 RepID=A0ABQ7D187_BRACR|nr:hypothetical protein DY000_02013868 [Brassica cretica]